MSDHVDEITERIATIDLQSKRSRRHRRKKHLKLLHSHDTIVEYTHRQYNNTYLANVYKYEIKDKNFIITDIVAYTSGKETFDINDIVGVKRLKYKSFRCIWDEFAKNKQIILQLDYDTVSRARVDIPVLKYYDATCYNKGIFSVQKPSLRRFIENDLNLKITTSTVYTI